MNTTETKDTIGDEKYIKDDSDCFTPLIENNNIETESLEDAAKKHSPARVGINSFPEKKAFIAGGNWQKEKDKVIIDKLIEALEKTNNEYNYSLKLLAESDGLNYSENHFSISNKQLLQSLK